MSQKKMSEQDKTNWDKLYRFVEKVIFQYNDDKKLSKYCILRLKSLQYGKFIYNSKKENKKIIYPLLLIYLTFLYKKKDILRYIDRTTFKNEQHKINSIMVIIENSINDVYDQVKAKKKQKENINNIKLEHKDKEQIATYKTKSSLIDEDNEDIWYGE